MENTKEQLSEHDQDLELEFLLIGLPRDIREKIEKKIANSLTE